MQLMSLLFILKMEVVHSSRRSVDFCKATRTWCHIPEIMTLQSHYHENLELSIWGCSYSIICFWKKMALQKDLCEMTNCHDEKFTCTAKGSASQKGR
jgi:hypothetical protein